MNCTLVLNATYEPIQIVPWRRAVRMLFQEKVEIVAEYETVICSVSHQYETALRSPVAPLRSG